MTTLSTRDNRHTFYATTALALACAAGEWYAGWPILKIVLFFVGLTIMNLVCWGIRTVVDYVKVYWATHERNEWEASMHRAILMAKEADEYFSGEANLLSAFHSVVSQRQIEGVKKGYLNLGRL